MRAGLALSLIALGSAGAGGSTHNWSYSGPNGPAHWSKTCVAGKSQSPIDIRTASATRKQLPPLVFNYRQTALHIIDNGHSIQVDVDKGSTVATGGVRFPLVQFHFHKPGEEAIDGRHSAMVVHLVHRDAEGNLAVVAVLLRSGSTNSLVSTLWRYLPKQKGREESPPGSSDRSVSASPGQSILLHLCGLADHPAMHGRCSLVRPEISRQPFGRRNWHVRNPLSS